MLSIRAIYTSIVLQIIMCVATPLICMAQDEYTFKLFEGRKATFMARFIAEQRITEFRNYPYLYEGDLQGELADLEEFVDMPHSIVVVAYYNGEPIGYAVGVPLAYYLEHHDHFIGSQEILAKSGINQNEHYYLADVIILAQHRGNGVSVQLFKELEKYAYNNKFAYVSFVSEAHERHPLKPHDYQDLHALWHYLGYRETGIILRGIWNTVQVRGGAQNQDHPLPFWVKKLEN